jgi:hypothetical protein
MSEPKDDGQAIIPTQTVPIASIKIGRRHRQALGDIKALAASIKDLGLLQPIVIRPDYTLVAGMRRIHAAKELGWTEIPARIVEGLDDALRLLEAERDENLCRLDFLISEKVALARVLRPLEDEAAKRRRQEHGGTAPGREKNTSVDSTGVSNGDARDKVAQGVRMGWQALERADEVVAAAEAEPEKYGDLVAQMDRKSKVQGAYRELCWRQEKERLQARWEAIRREPDYRPLDLIHSDFRTADIEPASVHAVITDPPYNADLDLFVALGEFAARVLRPGGSLVVMVGNLREYEIQQALSRHLNRQPTCVYETPGGQAPHLFTANFQSFHKPLLWFVRGEYAGRCIASVFTSNVNANDKRFHKWGQSESGMGRIVEAFSEPGQTVLDPFVGGGTTGAVALRLGRLFVGIDRDATAIKTCRWRLEQHREGRPDSRARLQELSDEDGG